MMRPMRQRWLLVLVAILFITNITTLSIFWLKKPNPADGPDPAKKEKRMGQFMVDQLKFDAGQEAAYWKLRDTMLGVQRPMMDSIRNAKKDFFDLLKDPNVNDSLLDDRSTAIAGMQQKLDVATFHHFQKVRAICHSDQLQKFDTVIKEIVNRMTPFRRMNNKGDSTGTQNAQR
jgi:periplasmic protein CpxP/Spy